MENKLNTFDSVRIPIFIYSKYLEIRFYKSKKKLNKNHLAYKKVAEEQYTTVDWQDEFDARAMTYPLIHDNSNYSIQPVVFDMNWDICANDIAHEAYHCACRILEDVDIPQCRETEEAYAYLIGFIAGSIEEEMINWKKARKQKNKKK